MRTTQAVRRGPSTLSSILIRVVVVVLLFTGAIAGLNAAGLIDLPFLKAKRPSHEGMVGVPMSARDIPPYTKLAREHIYDPERKELTYAYLPPKDVRPEMILDYNKIFGRVLAHKKHAGYVFTERDFFRGAPRRRCRRHPRGQAGLHR